jgi:putative ABC transport system permease protein
MMSDRRSVNRSMFWRVLRRSLFANRGRLFVILLALGAGAAVTAALLNLRVDAKRRIASDFTSFGPNAIIAPRGAGDAFSSEVTLPETIFDQLNLDDTLKGARASLYLVAEASSISNPQKPVRVVVAGTRALESNEKIAAPSSDSQPYGSNQHCFAGGRLAVRMRIQASDEVILRNGQREEPCGIALIWQHGDAEDDQILPSLGEAQRLSSLPGRISVIQLTLRGTSQELDSYIAQLQQRFPDVEVRPIRQFTEGEARLYGKISGILTATVAVVLILTALCVMAAMTNVAMERKNDVGLMKAIGGSVRRVLRLFLAEAALLGLAGGLIGAAVGIVISIGLGKVVFGVAAQPRFIVYPISVALTVIVAILAAYPLRRLVHIRPAAVFRGEE